MTQEASGLFVLPGLIVLAIVSVIAAFAWFAMNEEDPWFDEEQAKADVEELLACAAKEHQHRPRVRAIP